MKNQEQNTLKSFDKGQIKVKLDKKPDDFLKKNMRLHKRF